MHTKFLLGLCGLLLVGGAASAFSAAQEAGRVQRGVDTSCQHAPEHFGERGARPRFVQRLRRGREFARSLGVSEQQRELGRQAARELTPLAEELRPLARAIVERARGLRRQGDREGARALLRSELRPLLERAKPQAERAVDPLLRSLTAEQRAKLEAAAQRRGQQFDERRFAHRLGLVLASRRAQRRLDRTR